MNVNNLEVGKAYKNYKEVCDVLDEKVKAGKSKKLQLDNWERFFKYSKQGHKFTIEEVYTTPKIKQDLRSLGNNTSPYMDDIEELLLNLLAQDKNNGQLFLSRSRLLKELKMINENYTFYRNRKPALSKFMDIHIEEINDFYESSNSTFKSNLETALNRLQKQSLIYWTYALTVCYVDTSVQTTETGYIKATKKSFINEDGEKIVVFDTVKPNQQLAYRKATKDEIKIILDIEREKLKQYECNDKSELYKTGKIEDFYEDVNNTLFDKTNIVYYYNSYEVLFNERHIQERLEEIKLNEFQKSHTEKMLYEGIVEKLKVNAQNRHSKATEEIASNCFDDFYQPSEKLKQRSDGETYLSNNTKLTETLIDENYEHPLELKN